MDSPARQRVCDKCGTALQEREVYSFQEAVFCQKCYLGKSELGPHSKDYISCPNCDTILHRFTVVCFKCNSPIREVGKVEAEARGFGIRVLVFAVTVLALIVTVVALGPMGVARGGGAARSVTMAIVGPILVAAGFFRILFAGAFRKVPALAGLVGLLVGAGLFVGGLVMVILLPFP